MTQRTTDGNPNNNYVIIIGIPNYISSRNVGENEKKRRSKEKEIRRI